LTDSDGGPHMGYIQWIKLYLITRIGLFLPLFQW